MSCTGVNARSFQFRVLRTLQWWSRTCFANRAAGEVQPNIYKPKLDGWRWMKLRPTSGAKTDLRYPCSDLEKLYPTALCWVWIYLAIQMRCVVQPTIHTNSLWVWCSFLPYHASRFFSTESQDILIHPFFSSAVCGDVAQLCHEGWGYQHGLHSQCRGHNSLLERLLSLHWGTETLGQAGSCAKT